MFENNISRKLILHAATAVFTVAAYVLTWVGSTGCNIIEFVGDVPGASEPTIALKFGAWSYSVPEVYAPYLQSQHAGVLQGGSSCYLYPDYVNKDGWWTASKVFCVMTEVLGAILVIDLVVMNRWLSRRGWDIPVFVLTAISQGSALIFLNSKVCQNNLVVRRLGGFFPETCSISTGAKCMISATVLYLVATFLRVQLQIERKRDQLQLKGDNVDAAHPLISDP